VYTVLILLGSIVLIFLYRGLTGTDASFAQNGRLSGTNTSNPITLGHYGATLSLLSAYLLLRGARQTRKFVLLLLAGVILGVLIVLFSASRGPFLAFLVGAALLVGTLPRSRARTAIWLLSGATLLTFGLSYASVSDFVTRHGGSMERRLNSAARTNQTEAQDIRLGLWELAINTTIEHPLLGYGIDLPGQGYPHNIALEAFASIGVVGGTVFLALLATCLHRSLAMLRSGDECSWIGLLFVQFAVGAMFSGSLFTNAEFWCFCAAVAGWAPSSVSRSHRPWRRVK